MIVPAGQLFGTRRRGPGALKTTPNLQGVGRSYGLYGRGIVLQNGLSMEGQGQRRVYLGLSLSEAAARKGMRLAALINQTAVLVNQGGCTAPQQTPQQNVNGPPAVSSEIGRVILMMIISVEI